MLFLLRADESRYVQLFEELSKSAFIGIHEYPYMVNGACDLLVRTSRKFGGIILRVGRQNFRSERRRGGRTSIIFTQARGIDD